MTEHRPLDEIDADLAVAETAVARLREEKDAALVARAGVKVGDVVLAFVRQRGESVWLPGFVTKVNPIFDPPWLHVQIRRKDGEWGTTRKVYSNWKHLADHETDEPETTEEKESG